MLPKWDGRGRPPRSPLREIINSIRYVLRYGIPGDAMPKDLPPWYIGYAYFRKLGGEGRLDQINHDLLMKERDKSGRAPSPTVAITESAAMMAQRIWSGGSGTWPSTLVGGSWQVP